VHRQRDREMVFHLQDIRQGLLTPAASALFASRCSNPLLCDIGVEPTVLQTHNKQVDLINSNKLAELAGDLKQFRAEDHAHDPLLLSDAPMEETVYLKLHAQVVCVWNHGTLVNGSRGVVVNFDAQSGAPVVHFVGEAHARIVPPVTWTSPTEQRTTGTATRRQVPLRLAWALTIHRSQGMVRGQPGRPLKLLSSACSS